MEAWQVSGLNRPSFSVYLSGSCDHSLQDDEMHNVYTYMDIYKCILIKMSNQDVINFVI